MSVATANHTTPKSAFEFMQFFGSEYTAFKKERKGPGGMILVPITGISPAKHKKLIDKLIEQEEDVYFMINPGGPLAKDIVRPVACFLDLDAGRDSNKQYKSYDKVFQFKNGVAAKLAEMRLYTNVPPEPTAIVETRNGFQLYWKINHTSNVSMSRWNKVQKQLAWFFRFYGADVRVLKANQILRLPYTTWFKTYEEGSHEPFKVEIYDFSGREYSFGEIANAVKGFPNIKEAKQYEASRSTSNSPRSGHHVGPGGIAQAQREHTQKLRGPTFPKFIKWFTKNFGQAA